MSETVKCPNCGDAVPKSNRFCDNCGNKMAREESKKPELKKEIVKKEEENKDETKKPAVAAAKAEKRGTRAVDLIETVETETFDSDVLTIDGGLKKGFIFDWEKIIFAGIMLIAIISRFTDLGIKPLHHDESMHAFYGWKLLTGGGYEYNPMMHGPFLFHFNALIYFLFGTSDYTARVLPAIYGVLCVGLVYWLRSYLGRTGAIVTALIIAISPSFMYHSRFIRNDIYIAGDTLLMIIGMFKFFDTKKPWWLFLAAIGLGLSWATKEVTYITVAIFGSYFFFRWLWEYSIRNTECFGRENKLTSTIEFLTKKEISTLIYAFLIFFVINLVLYTTLFTNPKGIIDGFTKSLTYWMGQHDVRRGSQPIYYYLLLMPFYETISVVFGIIASVVYLIKQEKRTNFNIFLIYWAYGAVAAYSYAGERMPWLILHPLLPFTLLAGKYIGELITKKDNGWWKPVGLTLAIILSLASIHSAINLCFYGAGANPKESLIYVQSSTDTTKVAKMIKNFADDIKSHPELGLSGAENLEITCEDYCSWPYAWYLRDFKKVSYPHPVTASDRGRPLILSGIEAAAAGHDEQVAALLKDGYVAYKYKLREWWAADENMFSNMSLKDKITALWKRFMYRDVWSPLGSYDFVVYVRKDLEKYWK
ncbi:MAG: flippase activity-associated protein Agl23 [bacterium]